MRSRERARKAASVDDFNLHVTTYFGTHQASAIDLDCTSANKSPPFSSFIVLRVD